VICSGAPRSVRSLETPGLRQTGNYRFIRSDWCRETPRLLAGRAISKSGNSETMQKRNNDREQYVFESQVPFASVSVCDRITFARDARRNRTADLSSGEKATKLGCGVSARQFLQSGLGARIAELRRFRAIFRGMQPTFSAIQTAWRSE
jgi:hypothetical protein